MWTAEAGGGGNYISGFFFFKDSTGKGGFLYVTGFRATIQYMLRVIWIWFRSYFNGTKKYTKFIL